MVSLMNIQTLDKIFKPQRIALVGVSPNPKSVSARILANLVGGGFRGVVYPVSPAVEAVMGIPCFPSAAGLPKTPDLGIICAAAAQVPGLVRECGEAGVRGLIIISAGFRETGPAGLALEESVKAEALRFDGMRILGPNCLGVISPGLPLNASFAGAMPRPGHVAFVSQSGALCTSVLDWAAEEKLGFSHFVSTGNMLDVDFGDLIDYLGEDEATKSILLYIESIPDARKFMTAARAFARVKPIVAYKAGRFPESAAAAASHTGALAGEDAVYDAAFQRMGLARVFNIGEIFDCADLVGRPKVPKGPRLAVLTNAGGPGVMATDALVAAGGSLARLSDATLAELNGSLPPHWSRRNPVDVLGDAKSKLVGKAARIVLDDPGVDALLVIVTPQAMTNPTAVAREVAAQAAATPKPVLAAWLGGPAMREGTNLLNEAGIPTYPTPEQAVRAFMTLVSYARNLEILYETPKDVRVDLPVRSQRPAGPFRGDADQDRRGPLRSPVQGAPCLLRHPGDAPGGGGDGRRGRSRRRRGRLSRRAQDPVARHHPQDRRRRRGPRPRRRGGRQGRLRGRSRDRRPQGPGRSSRGCHRPEDGPGRGRRGDDPRYQEGPDLRHRRPGRHGRDRGRDLR